MSDRDKEALTAEEYERLAGQLAREHAPRIYPCAHCKRPVADGYCCTFCGSSNPRGRRTEDDAPQWVCPTHRLPCEICMDLEKTRKP